MCRALLRAGAMITLVGAAVVVPSPGLAVERSCGPDAVANTATVLCAAPSGPCTATLVRVTANIEVTAGGCAFDLDGRAVQFERTLEMTGLGFIRVFDAGNVTVTSTGKLKARGDFVQPNGFIVGGGLIALESGGRLAHAGVLDVSGDSAGEIVLVAVGDVAIASSATLTGNGITILEEGERYADGGTLIVESETGSVTIDGDVVLRGNNQAAGGLVSVAAARSCTIGKAIDLSGGGSDGGELEVIAGDHVSLTKRVDVSSRVGGGSGGSITLAAGDDGPGDAVPGGTVDVETSTLDLRGSATDEFGGDGGDVDVTALGRIRFFGSGVAIRADAATNFDGSGGTISLDASDASPDTLGPLDGDLELGGIVSLRSGSTDGDGGTLEMIAGRHLVLTAAVDASGRTTGGEIIGDAGGSVLLNGVLTAESLASDGDGGVVDFTAGRAESAGLTVQKNILVKAGTASSDAQSVTLAGCALTIANGVKIDGSGGIDAQGRLGGADVELISRSPMQLGSSSQYLAPPGGTITTTHPPGQAPVIGSGVVFNPPRISNPTAMGGFPNCPVCGDGVRQAGEVCDKGAAADGACCNATCSAFVCPTPTTTTTASPAGAPTATPTPTPSRTATATATPSRTPTPTISATPAPTTGTPTAGAPSPATPTATLVPTATPTPTATAMDPTATPTATPLPSPTATRHVQIVDHYKCYKAETASGTSGFVQRELGLADRFETKRTRVLRSTELCLPVDVNGRGIADPATHLQCYALRNASGEPRFRRRAVETEDELGALALTLRKIHRLCVPANVGATPPDPTRDAFKCYLGRHRPGTPRFAPREATLVDALEAKLVRVVRPTSLCVTTGVDGAPARAPSTELHCYAMSDVAGQPGFARRDVVAANALATETLTLQKPSTVCVSVAVETPPGCGDGFVDPSEECDDGNQSDGDGCDVDCRLERCGDGIPDPGEECDHGPANGVDECCSALCRVIDPDDDGLCTAADTCPLDADNDSDGDGFCVGTAFRPPAIGGDDPCSRPAETNAWSGPKLVLTKLDRPGDAALKLKGTFIVPVGTVPLAPERHGVHLRIVDADGTLILDERIPGGAYSPLLPVGWKVGGSPPRKWTYLDRVHVPPRWNGVKRIVIVDQSTKVPGRLKIVIEATGGHYPVAPGQEPLRVALELDDRRQPPGGTPGVGQCGEIAFGLPPAAPSCAFGGAGSRLVCK